MSTFTIILTPEQKEALAPIFSEAYRTRMTQITEANIQLLSEKINTDAPFELTLNEGNELKLLLAAYREILG